MPERTQHSMPEWGSSYCSLIGCSLCSTQQYAIPLFMWRGPGTTSPIFRIPCRSCGADLPIWYTVLMAPPLTPRFLTQHWVPADLRSPTNCRGTLPVSVSYQTIVEQQLSQAAALAREDRMCFPPAGPQRRMMPIPLYWMEKPFWRFEGGLPDTSFANIVNDLHLTPLAKFAATGRYALQMINIFHINLQSYKVWREQTISGVKRARRDRWINENVKAVIAIRAQAMLTLQGICRYVEANRTFETEDGRHHYQRVMVAVALEGRPFPPPPMELRDAIDHGDFASAALETGLSPPLAHNHPTAVAATALVSALVVAAGPDHR